MCAVAMLGGESVSPCPTFGAAGTGVSVPRGPLDSQSAAAVGPPAAGTVVEPCSTKARRRGKLHFHRVGPAGGAVHLRAAEPPQIVQVEIRDSVIRYAVGIEDADDLIADLACLEQV